MKTVFEYEGFKTGDLVYVGNSNYGTVGKFICYNPVTNHVLVESSKSGKISKEYMYQSTVFIKEANEPCCDCHCRRCCK